MNLALILELHTRLSLTLGLAVRSLTDGMEAHRILGLMARLLAEVITRTCDGPEQVALLTALGPVADVVAGHDVPLPLMAAAQHQAGMVAQEPEYEAVASGVYMAVQAAYNLQTVPGTEPEHMQCFLRSIIRVLAAYGELTLPEVFEIAGVYVDTRFYRAFERDLRLLEVQLALASQ